MTALDSWVAGTVPRTRRLATAAAESQVGGDMRFRLPVRGGAPDAPRAPRFHQSGRGGETFRVATALPKNGPATRRRLIGRSGSPARCASGRAIAAATR